MAIIYNGKMILNKELKKILKKEEKEKLKREKELKKQISGSIYFISGRERNFKLYEGKILSEKDGKYLVRVKGRFDTEYIETLITKDRVRFD